MTDRDAQAESWVRGEMAMGESVAKRPNQDQLREDVIYAVRRLLEADRRNGGHRSHNEGGRGFSFAKVPLEEFKALAARVQALDAPTPVWPCEKYVGARFRFEPGPGEAGTGICKLYCLDGEFLWSMAGDASLFRFRSNARIIPIKGEEE